jgi:hypothetical protein
MHKARFSEFYKATIGVDFALDDQTTVSLQLWGIAGQEHHGAKKRLGPLLSSIWRG